MKKVLLISALTVLLSVSFAGCGEKKEAAAPENIINSEYSASENSEQMQENQEMQENSEISEQMPQEQTKTAQ